MKTISTTAIVALMTATIGLTTLAPSFAQDAAPAAAPQEQAQNFRQHQGGLRHQGGLGFLGFDRGVEAVEIAFVRLSHAVELTAEQQPLFDAFKTAAVAAATDLEAALEGLRPAAPAEGETAPAIDFADRIENRIAIEAARLAALEAVQPAAAAFFDSLTDEQKAALTPQRPDRDGGPGFGKQGGPRHGMHQNKGPMGGNGPMEAAPAPQSNG